MAKAKTSTKQKFSIDDIPVRRLKKDAPVLDYNTSIRLKNPKLVLDALLASLLEGDAEAFKEILSGHLDLIKKDSFYKKAGVSKRTLYRMLSVDGNPTLDNVARVVSALAQSSSRI